jgi:hypothetical protein
MARKGKGFNIKQVFVDHGEKMAFAGILVMVVLALASTNWVPYGKQPSEFTENIEKAEKTIAVTAWPETDRETFQLQEESLPARIVDMGINDRIPVTPRYLHSQTQLKDKDARDDPLQEPEFLPVVELMATDAKVNIRQAPKEEDLLAAQGLKPDGTPIDPNDPRFAAAAEEEDKPDEFQQSNGGFGAAGGYESGDEAFTMGGRSPLMGRGARDYASTFAPELQRGARGGPGARGAAARGRESGRAAGGRGRGARGGAQFDEGDGGLATTRGGRNRGRDRNTRGRDIDDRGGPRGALAGFDEGDEMGLGGYGGIEVDGKGYPFVSVRGVFQFREQIRKYSEAIHKGRSEALMHFMIIDFHLERQRLVSAPDTWTAWEPVNDDVLRDVLNQADGFDPEVVSGAVTDSSITCPLPARLYGRYNKQATHPKLEKFALSEDDMQLELKYSEMLLKRAIDQKKLPTGMVKKRGFNDIVFDSRSIQQGVFGYSSPYAMGAAMDDEDRMPSMTMGRGGAAMPLAGRAGMGANRGAMGTMMNQTIDQLVAELAKDMDDAESKDAAKSKEVTEKLKKFITERAAPEGDLLLFRYFDFDIEPGETYRYRVQLELQNPNYGQPLGATGGVASVVMGETRLTPWSEPTTPVTVDDTVKYFLTSIQPPKALVYPDARMNIFQYDQDIGTVVNQELDVSFGQNVGGKAKTEQADPAKGTLEDVDYTFKSEDILIDALPDVRLTRTEHPDLQLPPDSRGLAQVPEIAAVVTPRGQVETIDPMSQKNSLETAKKNKGYQDDLFEQYRSPDEGLGGEYDALYGGMDNGDEDMFAGAGLRGMGGRNPLRKGSGGRGGRGR